MIFLASVGYIALLGGIVWASVEIFSKLMQRKIKKTVEKCLKTWEESPTVRRVYVTKENFVEEKVKTVLEKNGLKG